jgi:hypothetical protein
MKKSVFFVGILSLMFSVCGQEDMTISFMNDYNCTSHLSLIIYTPDGKIQTRVSDLIPNQVKSYSFPIHTEIFIADSNQEAFAMKGNDLKASGVKSFLVVGESDNKKVFGLSSIEQNIDDSLFTTRTINCGTEDECDIELVKKDCSGKELWALMIGGTSYDKASQVIKAKDGSCLLVGSTSSFGKGNYDAIVVKVSSHGKIIWQQTYGDFFNDFGLGITSINNDLYQIKGTKQLCKTANISSDCYSQDWIFRIDENGVVQ